MIRKTEAIVLRTQPYLESSLLTTCYTRTSGVRNFIVQGYRSTRSKKRHSYFQPMSVIDVVYYYKDNRDLQKITESSCSFFLQTLQTDPRRIALGLLVIEVFQQTVKEQEENEPLFDFLKNTLAALDRAPDHLIHIVLWYLLHLTAHLGFIPADETASETEPVFFDTLNGRFLHAPAANISDPVLLQLLHTDLFSCREISFSNEQKREMLDTLFRFYKFHIEGFREPESLKVFGEVFG